MDKLEYLKLGGLVIEIAEDQLGASVGGDEGSLYVKSLIDNYVICGKPTPAKKWFLQQMKGDFTFKKEKPVWHAPPQWLFHSARPMSFVGQVDVNDEIVDTAGGMYTIYVFAIKETYARAGQSLDRIVAKTVIQDRLGVNLQSQP